MDSTLLIKNARIIDPGQQIDRITDIAVIDGKVHSFGDNIDLVTNSVLDARECIVTPGWIDSHVHCYEHSTPLGINVDRYCLARGVTTVVDAGSAGKIFPQWLIRGGSRIPQRRGANPPGGRQHMILPNFAKNCMKLRKFWAVGGRARQVRPP